MALKRMCSRCRGKKVFKTAEEAVEYLFSEELESEMIVLSPEVDEFTDEECFDDSETLDPSTSRGSQDFYFDVKNKITALKWNDNKCVTLEINFDIIESLTFASRRKKGKAEKNKIEQPCLVNNYNKNMGGIESRDWLLEKNTIRIRGKKWCWPIITRIVDIAVVNICVIYNMVNAEKKSVKEIRRNIAIAYQKKRQHSTFTNRYTKLYNFISREGNRHC
ncbi:piggyBac transposable element-derived protein 2 [Nephila pilipes]|uniref:PiggyBac transposable element-derived protein 2 n=1 Tax=Nephila pilipes TaxID=299642 RepID=A0A8X6N3V6_NEPPI|nr:piggyBac transposable element-derived protein 2 [Nephila pilipes]